MISDNFFFSFIAAEKKVPAAALTDFFDTPVGKHAAQGH